MEFYLHNNDINLHLLLHHCRHVNSIVARGAANNVAAILPLQLISEGLKLVNLPFNEQLFYNLGDHVYVVVFVISLMFFFEKFLKDCLVIALLRAYDYALHESSEGFVVFHGQHMLCRGDTPL